MREEQGLIRREVEDTGMIDREQIAADWAERDFSCELWTDPPGQRWQDFTHATDEVVIVLMVRWRGRFIIPCRVTNC